MNRLALTSDEDGLPVADADAAPAVLCVEDDIDNALLVQRSLRRYVPPFRMRHVTNGPACLTALAAEPFAAILLDYTLPGMNGLEVLARIKAMGLTIPVVMVTGQNDDRVVVEALRAGAMDYVVKTMGYHAALPMVVTKVLKQHELARDNARLSEAARGQEARLAHIFASISDGIVLLGGDGRVMCANRAAAQLLGFDTDAAVGRALVELVHGDIVLEGTGGSTAGSIDALTAAVTRREGDLRLGGGRPVLRWTAQPTAEGAGEPGSVTITFRDVTREREIARLKADFVSFVAHQLRTPLSGIKWMLELARQEPEVPPVLGSYVEDASAAADRLIAMVTALLEISRLESDSVTVQTQPTDLGRLTLDVLEGLEREAGRVGVALSFAGSTDVPAVAAEPALLRQAILNLVSNAVKYTPAGGQVVVRMHAEGAHLVWTVTDTGIGIPQADQPRLFEKFFRAENAMAVDPDGTGLGLYLVHLIVKRLAGGIRWTSAERGGSTFALSLPLAK